VQNDWPRGHGGSRRYAKNGGPKLDLCGEQNPLNANEFLAMVGTRIAPKIICDDDGYWASGGANVWLVQIRTA
jgi:hypothetical protein